VLAVNVTVGDAAVLNGNVMGTPTLPAGIVVVDPEPVTVQVIARDGPVEELEQVPAGSVVVRPDSIVPGAVVVISEPVGCCGLDGQDGPNQGCAACGQVLGTAWTDCWTPHEVRLLPNAVLLVGQVSA